MPKSLLSTIADKWKEKEFDRIISEDLSKILELDNRHNDIVMCIIFGMEAIVASTKCNSYLLNFTQLAEKFKKALMSTPNVDNFNLLTNIHVTDRFYSLTIEQSWLSAIANCIIDSMSKECMYRRAQLRLFVLTVIKLEQLTSTKLAISISTFNKLNQIWTKHEPQLWIDCISNILGFCSDPNASTLQDLQHNVRIILSENEDTKYNIGAMMSLILKHCAMRLSENISESIIQGVLITLNNIYKVISQFKSKEFSNYNWLTCCNRTEKHLALDIFETSRILLCNALKRNIYNEIIISYSVNFIVAECEVIQRMECCSHKNFFVYYMCSSVAEIVTNLPKNETFAERSIRSVNKLFSCEILNNYRYMLANKLCEIYESVNKVNDLIKACALRVACSNSKEMKWAIFKMYEAQNKEPFNEYKTIMEILDNTSDIYCGKSLTYNRQSVIYVMLLVQQSYGTLNEKHEKEFLLKLKDEINKLKGWQLPFTKAIYTLLCYQRERKTLLNSCKQIKIYTPFTKEENVTLENEIKLIDYLMRALNEIWKCLQLIDTVPDDYKNLITSTAIDNLLRIAYSLMNRQYKDLAIKGFEYLYKATAMANLSNCVKETFAAGVLLEHSNLCSDAIDLNEILRILKRNIQKNLKDFHNLTTIEQSEVMMAILSLAMYLLENEKDTVNCKKSTLVVMKLLEKYETINFTAVRIKWNTIMLKMIIDDENSHITPIIFSEDLTLQCKNFFKYSTNRENYMLPTVLFNLTAILIPFATARYEFSIIEDWLQRIWFLGQLNGYILLLGKGMLMSAEHNIYVETWTRTQSALDQLDAICGVVGQLETETPLEAQIHLTKKKNGSCALHKFEVLKEFLHEINMRKVQFLVAQNNMKANVGLKASQLLENVWDTSKNSIKYANLTELKGTFCVMSDLGLKKEAENCYTNALKWYSRNDFWDRAVMQNIEAKILCCKKKVQPKKMIKDQSVKEKKQKKGPTEPKPATLSKRKNLLR